MFKRVISLVVIFTLIFTSLTGLTRNVTAESTGSYSFLTYEAEDTDNQLGGAAAATEFAGASGNNVLALASATADSVTITNINVQDAGEYSLYIHYATTGAAIGIITANTSAPADASFEATTAAAISVGAPWGDQAGTVAVPVTLNAGVNSIKIAAVSGSVYIDKIVIDTKISSFEAESPSNTLQGGGSTSDNSGASGGKQVNNFSQTGGVVFGDINVDNPGKYIMTLTYCTKDPRNFKLIINHGAPIRLDCPSTSPDNWDTMGTFKTEVNLVKGKNTIEFYSFDYGPNLDKITLNAAAVQELPPYPTYEGTLYEAEAADNTIEGTVKDNIYASGGKYVINLGSKSLTYNNITVSEDGYYKVTVLYSVGDNTRSFNLSVNDALPVKISTPSTNFWDKIGKAETVVSLRAGTNKLKFDNSVTGWAPNLDAIAIAAGAPVPEGPTSGEVYEAEAAELANGAEIQGNAKASNSELVGNLGDPSRNGSVTFNNIYAKVGGSQTLSVYYVSGSDDRSFDISINGEAPIRVACPKTADDWSTVGKLDINAILKQGKNTIKFDNSTWYAPNLDKLVIDNSATAYEAESSQNVLGGNASISLNSKASSGVQIGNLGGDQNGSLKFANVYAGTSGNYMMKVDYASGSQRAFDVSVNGLPAVRLNCPAVINDDWETTGSVYLPVALLKGINTITFDNKSGYSPNLDRISLTQGITSYEAEADGNTLEGGAAVSGDSAEDSGRRHVGNLGGGGPVYGSVQFNNVYAAASGTYKLSAYYISGSDDRYFTVKVNSGSDVRLNCPGSGGWSNVGKIETLIALNEGNNIIKFGSDYYAPNLDKIEISEWPLSYEGEDTLNTVADGATVDSNSKDSGDRHVGNLGNGSVQFNHVNVNKAGQYKMKLFYISGSDDRSYDISVNGAPTVNVPCPKSDDNWSKAASVDVSVQLAEGDNTIRFSKAGGYAPNLDRIEINTDIAIPVKNAKIITLANGNVKIDYDLNSGTADFYYNGVKKITGFYSSVQTDKLITSKDYTTRSAKTVGNETVITSEKAGYPVMKQRLILDSENHFLAEVSLEGTSLSSNWMSPVMTDSPGSVDIGSYGDNRALFVPFDNDAWIRYNAGSINRDDISYEVSAFYNNSNRNGLVIGSVSHDTWKTGIYFKGSENRLDRMYAFGGATSAVTRDRSYHGSVTGSTIASPEIFVGYYSDWRSGMEEFAQANAAQTAKLDWNGGVPFGWNSWGKIQSSINYDKAVGVSNFIHDELQNKGFSNDNTVYVNLDSYWDNMNDSQLAAFVQNCKNNGQRAGIYWAPFVDWGKNAARQVETTNYTYQEIWLKDSNGNPIELDGAYALDPTHPGTKARIDYFIDRFKNAGFEFIKLDFLAHGSIEGGSNNGIHYDNAVKTGIQAYNQGMQYVNDRIDGEMFISLAISPVFPYQYAHARRVACDSYGAVNETEYTMNSATYGWWLSGALYEYNDPDHMVLEGHSPDENMSRITSGVVAGTVFLNGDDLTGEAGQNLAKKYLTNPAVNAVAKIGKPFVSVENNTGSNAGDTFVIQDGSTFYIAAFNYSSGSVSRALSLSRAGLDGSTKYDVTELWEGAKTTATGTLQSLINAKGVKLYKLTKAPMTSPGTPSGNNSSGNTSSGNTSGNHSSGAAYDSRNSIIIVKDDKFIKSIEEALGGKTAAKTLKLKVEPVKNAVEYSITIPASGVTAKSGNLKLELETEFGSITVPSNMLEGAKVLSKGNISLSIGTVNPDKLDGTLKDKIGNKPIVELKVYADGKLIEYNNIKAPVKVRLPYIPTAEELKNPEHLVIWYLAPNGSITPVTNARFNSSANALDFTTTLFGRFAAAFINKTFGDMIQCKWAIKPVEVLASKGIVSGTSETGFSPRKNITRVEFMTWLIKALDLKAEFSSNFSDVSKTNSNYEAIAIAKALGITSGVGNNKFNPDREISRQDMMVLTEKALKAADAALKTGSKSDLAKFNDALQVAGYAEDAVAALVKSGYIVGSNNKLNPSASITRAETAAVLYKIYTSN